MRFPNSRRGGMCRARGLDGSPRNWQLVGTGVARGIEMFFLPDGGIDKLNHWTMTVLKPVEGISPTGKKTLERIARRRGYRNWRFLT